MFYTLLRLFLPVYFASAALYADPVSRPLILVTVAPHQHLIKRLAGDTVDVQIIVPPQANVHTFEPTPRQMMSAARADLWFRLGETFEPRLAQALKSHNPNLGIIDLREAVALIAGGCCKHHESFDLHFWLSPRELKQQATAVTEVLSNRYPAHREQYQKALTEHLHELDLLDGELRETLAPLAGKTVLVVHPAYGYLSRDYGFEQLSVETEGKDPAPQQLLKILQRAKDQKITTIYTQLQYSPKAAEIVRRQLGESARLVMLDPYAEDYMKNLREIAQQFAR